MRVRSRWCAAAAVFLCAGLGATSAALTGPTIGAQPASASTICNVGRWNTEGYQNNGLHRGVRVHNPPGSGMWIETVGSPDPYCVRVSSLIVQNTTGSEQVEVGWEDMSNGIGTIDCDNGPSGYTGTGPELFWALKNGNLFYCNQKNEGNLTQGQYDTFTVEDPTQTGDWEYWHNGTEFNSESFPDLTDGEPVTNGERHNQSTDIPWSHFSGMQYESGSWLNWDAFSNWALDDTDPNNGNLLYRNHLGGGNDWDVYVQQPPSC